jgi:hypothetical protein
LKRASFLTALFCALLLAACGGKSEPKPRVQSFLEVEPPVQVSELTLPGLVRLSDGALVMTLFIHSAFPSATDSVDAIAVLRSDDNGTSWNELSRIPSHVTYGVWGYDLATDGRGGLCLTWVAAMYRKDSPSPFKAVMFSRSDDGGATWTEPVRVSDISRGQRRNSVLAASGTNVAVAWLDGGGETSPKAFTEADVYFSSSADGGVTWSPNRCIELDLDRKWTSPATPSLYMEDSGTLHVGYFSGRIYDDRRVTFWLASSPDNGASFENMAQDLGPLGNVSLAMLKGKPVLAAVYIKAIKQISMQDPQTAQEVRFYSRDGAEWGEPVRIDDDPNNRHKSNLHLVSLGAGRLLAVWDDDRSGLYAAASLDGGESWGINVPLGFNSTVGITPFDVIGDPATGSFLVAASDVRMGGGDATFLIKGRVVGEQPPE